MYICICCSCQNPGPPPKKTHIYIYIYIFFFFFGGGGAFSDVKVWPGVPVNILAVCFGATFTGVSGVLLFPKYGLSGCRCGFWGCFFEGFVCAFFAIFGWFFGVCRWKRSVFCVFWGFRCAPLFLRGSKKGVFRVRFSWGFGDFFGFWTSLHENTIFIGFSGGHRFLSENHLRDPYFCSVFACGALSELQLLVLSWPKPLFF